MGKSSGSLPHIRVLRPQLALPPLLEVVVLYALQEHDEADHNE